MQIGYARVSTDDQDTAAQVAALKAAGCERIYKEKASGGRWDRAELHRFWISSERVTCWWSGNWTGCLAPAAMSSLSWSGLGKRGQDSVGSGWTSAPRPVSNGRYDHPYGTSWLTEPPFLERF